MDFEGQARRSWFLLGAGEVELDVASANDDVICGAVLQLDGVLVDHVAVVALQRFMTQLNLDI